MAEMQPEAVRRLITMHDPTAGETLAATTIPHPGETQSSRLRGRIRAESHHARLASSHQGLSALRSCGWLKSSHQGGYPRGIHPLWRRASAVNAGNEEEGG